MERQFSSLIRLFVVPTDFAVLQRSAAYTTIGTFATYTGSPPTIDHVHLVSRALGCRLSTLPTFTANAIFFGVSDLLCFLSGACSLPVISRLS